MRRFNAPRVQFGTRPVADALPTPLLRRAAARRTALLAEAADVLKVLPAPGEALHRGLDRSVVAEFLASVRAAGSSVCLLHTGGDEDSRHWQGDVDLLVTSDRAAFLRAMKGRG